MIQRQDSCLQSRRWLFDSVCIHYRGSQVVKGSKLKTRDVGFRRFESCPRYCAAIPKWPKGDG